ncbi:MULTISPECIES: formyltetrahydrofolate deformylase [Thermoactinomyces]|jgi:formyltetrahydrofolate deformylase|uniref:Formyltetrahydrofolate deformylase n=1 Tax=Thermoactinomyces daqus TaxID=1329516 RepID=A0A7W1XAJ5_9BACL|nr:MULTISPECIES: formyltetrahydrofolate deformylase [Thermoactinomyces]MBA4543066.1 formyltetrahydrofolate deformylase [Thermoactinomyces daqus]MBH8598726.1 formyltetrahydrofolate deformylase [Thermoactinomyces sp. CICC 10523]MBH8605523.1 formyltetrahydrofolate deformylase [Thermoactinomyces sp. CICC 10522]MBH8608790.1 formyltetrahydrofolate deformylase [Thermoactinomyces sp. CICC 10521]
MHAVTETHPSREKLGRLLISCSDRPGIIAAVSRFLHEQGANIVDSHQYTTDPEGGFFFMRVEFQLPNLTRQIETLRERFSPIANSFDMNWRITPAAKKQKMAVFVSKEDHCLREILWRWSIGELYADIAMVISNHPNMEAIVAPFGIPYYHVPFSKENRDHATRIHLELLEKGRIDTIVLARYMQIIPPDIIDRYQNQIINIHHSFLPAFAGGKPYHQAYDRGVKIIGATAHYVTEELDQGPIIEQDVQRVDHRHQVEDLKRIGRDVERMVLARAVQWHLNDQVLVHGNKTIVFR